MLLNFYIIFIFFVNALCITIEEIDNSTNEYKEVKTRILNRFSDYDYISQLDIKEMQFFTENLRSVNEGCNYDKQKNVYYCSKNSIIYINGKVIIRNNNIESPNNDLKYTILIYNQQYIETTFINDNNLSGSLELFIQTEDNELNSVQIINLTVYKFSKVIITRAVNENITVPILNIMNYVETTDYILRVTDYYTTAVLIKNDNKYKVYGKNIDMYYGQGGVFPDTINLNNYEQSLEIYSAPSQLTIVTNVSIIASYNNTFQLELEYLADIETFLYSVGGVINISKASGRNGSFFIEPFNSTIIFGFIESFSSVYIMATKQIDTIKQKNELLMLYPMSLASFFNVIKQEINFKSNDKNNHKNNYNNLLSKRDSIISKKINKPNKDDPDPNGTHGEVTIDNSKIDFALYLYTKEYTIEFTLSTTKPIVVPILYTNTIYLTEKRPLPEVSSFCIFITNSEITISDFYIINEFIMFITKKSVKIGNVNLINQYESIVFGFDLLSNYDEHISKESVILDISAINCLFNSNTVFLMSETTLIETYMYSIAERDNKSLKLIQTQVNYILNMPNAAIIKNMQGLETIYITSQADAIKDIDTDIIICVSDNTLFLIESIEICSKIIFYNAFEVTINRIFLVDTLQISCIEANMLNYIDDIVAKNNYGGYDIKLYPCKNLHIQGIQHNEINVNFGIKHYEDIKINTVNISVWIDEEKEDMLNMKLNGITKLQSVKFDSEFKILVFYKEIFVNLISFLKGCQILYKEKTISPIILENKIAIKGIRRFAAFDTCIFTFLETYIKLYKNAILIEAESVYSIINYKSDTNINDSDTESIFLPSFYLIGDLIKNVDRLNLKMYLNDEFSNFLSTLILMDEQKLNEEYVIKIEVIKDSIPVPSTYCKELDYVMCINLPDIVINIGNLRGRGKVRESPAKENNEICCSGSYCGYGTCNFNEDKIQPTNYPTPGYYCQNNNLIPGRPGGIVYINANEIEISGIIIDLVGENGECNTSGTICSGSGSGGYFNLEANNYNLIAKKTLRISVEGGNCNVNVGSAGGAGKISIKHPNTPINNLEYKYFINKNFYFSGGECENKSAGDGVLEIDPINLCGLFKEIKINEIGCKFSVLGLWIIILIAIIIFILLIIIIYTFIYFFKLKKNGSRYCCNRKKIIRLNNPYVMVPIEQTDNFINENRFLHRENSYIFREISSSYDDDVINSVF